MVMSPSTTTWPSASAARPVAVNVPPAKTLIEASRPAKFPLCAGRGNGFGHCAPVHAPSGGGSGAALISAATPNSGAVSPVTTAARRSAVRRGRAVGGAAGGAAGVRVRGRTEVSNPVGERVFDCHPKAAAPPPTAATPRRRPDSSARPRRPPRPAGG